MHSASCPLEYWDNFISYKFLAFVSFETLQIVFTII